MPVNPEESSKASPETAKPAAKKAPKKAPAKKSAARKSSVAVPVAKRPETCRRRPRPRNQQEGSREEGRKEDRPPALTTAGQASVTEAKRLSGWDFATWRMATDDPVMRSTIIGLLVWSPARTGSG